MSSPTQTDIHGQDPVTIRPNIYSIIEMALQWCGLLLAIEFYLLGQMIWDNQHDIGTSSNVVSAFWLILIPLGVASYITATWAFSSITLWKDCVILRKSGYSETVPAADVTVIKHRNAKGLRHLLLVTTLGSIWINKSAYSFTQLEGIIDYVKVRSRHLS